MYIFFLILHHISFILGVGSATVYHLFSVARLRNLVWMSIVLLFASGFGLFWIKQAELMGSHAFWAKTTVAFLIPIFEAKSLRIPSLVSWWFVLVLGSLFRSADVHYVLLMSSYVMLLFSAVSVSKYFGTSLRNLKRSFLETRNS